MVGEGAFAHKHLDALARIEGVEVVSIAGGVAAHTRAAAGKYGIAHWTTDLAEGLSQPGVEAAILASPTQVHASQAEQAMRAGKHVLIEIPIADSLADAERLVEVQRETGLVAMVDHVRRFNPSHQWMHNRRGRVRGRHRAGRPRIPRRHPGGTRAQRQRRAVPRRDADPGSAGEEPGVGVVTGLDMSPR